MLSMFQNARDDDDDDDENEDDEVLCAAGDFRLAIFRH